MHLPSASLLSRASLLSLAGLAFATSGCAIVLSDSPCGQPDDSTPPDSDEPDDTDGPDDTGETGDTTPASAWSAVAAGGTWSCGLTDAGEIRCWGASDGGATTPPADQAYSAIAAGEDFACALGEDRRLHCWGDNADQQTEAPDNPATSFFLGGAHACSLSRSGEPTCWGSDSDGQATPPEGVAFAELALGTRHSCGRLEDGTVQCWGANRSGEGTPPAGTFTAITRHIHGDADPNDCHWEKRYIATLDDFRRVAEADRELETVRQLREKPEEQQHPAVLDPGGIFPLDQVDEDLLDAFQTVRFHALHPCETAAYVAIAHTAESRRAYPRPDRRRIMAAPRSVMGSHPDSSR